MTSTQPTGPGSCPICGAPLPASARFCGECGTPGDSREPVAGSPLRSGWVIALLVGLAVAVVVLLSLLLVNLGRGSASGSSARPDQPQGGPAVSTSTTLALSVQLAVTVPVNECPTQQGIPQTQSEQIPSTIALTLPSEVAHKVAFYSDSTRSLAPILGPKGWSCSVGEAVDGGIGVSIYPASETADFPATYNASQVPPSPSVVIKASDDGGCQSCVADTVCPYVPEAEVESGYGQSCPTSLLPDETVKWLNGSPGPGFNGTANDLISFTIPAGSPKPGVSSGRFADEGVLSYQSMDSEASDSELDCVLPPADENVCQAAFSDFINRSWPSQSDNS